MTRKSPVAAALWLVNTMFCLAALYVLLDAQFIGAIQVLVYAGAIDDRPTTRRSDVQGAQNYVREAVQAVSSGQPVKTATTRAYGCTVKYL